MLAFALMLQAVVVPQQDYSGTPTLPRYADKPVYDPADLRACRAEYDRLQTYTSHYKSYVTGHDIDRNGRLEWTEGRDIRNVADMAQRNYQEAIRRIAWQGRVAECRALATRGIKEVRDHAVVPVFGETLSDDFIMNYRN